MTAVKKGVLSFARFWWDFLVGDTPELFLAVLAVIGLAFALHRQTAAGVVVVLVAVTAFLTLSTWRGRRRNPPVTSPEEESGS